MTDTTDKELLEKAAMAAGMTVDTHYVDGGCSVWLGEPRISDWRPDWNPLTDDGDALRLAVKLRIDLDFDELNPIVEAYRKIPGDACHVHCEALTPDAAAATRRAIVRAAALGRAGEVQG